LSSSAATLARTAPNPAERLAAQARELELARRSAEEARRALEEAEELLADISHELRTPLNAILGAIELLLETPLSPRQRELAELVRAGGRSQLAVIGDILDLAKAAAGVPVFAAEPVDLLSVVRETVALFTREAEARGLRLGARQVCASIPTVIGDGTRIGRVVANLVGNAVKFTRAGGVDVRVGCDAMEGGRARLCVTVEDTGVGIPADQLELAFQRFTRLHTSSRCPSGGAGLGLAIAKRLVEGMGGTIGATSRLGEGTTLWFTLDLPVARKSAITRARAGRGSRAGTGRTGAGAR
jgi:signal transduction histidine kinase